jgi:hypothetical protein
MIELAYLQIGCDGRQFAFGCVNEAEQRQAVRR